MLSKLAFRIPPTRIGATESYPRLLQPLIEAAAAGQDLVPPINRVVADLGFDSLTYGGTVTQTPHPKNEMQMYVFTTLSADWVQRYDARAYVEIDPRVFKTWDSAVPMIWDQRAERGQSPKVDAFLDDALAHGIGSGLAYTFHHGFGMHVVFALNSREPSIDSQRYAEITKSLGDVVLFATTFHGIFLRGIVEKGLPPVSQGAPLSPREKECLSFAAQGWTGSEIASKLGIAERTVQFHFTGICTKLGAANRHEAIARAIKTGVIAG